MSKLPNVPDFTDDPQSMSTALRAVKQAVEIIGGQRQGQSLGAPQVFVQENEPTFSPSTTFSIGDQWIKPSARVMSFWDGRQWLALA